MSRRCARLAARTLAYVSDEDDRAIRTVDLDSHAELAKTPLDGRPAQILAGADGRLYVTLRDESKVAILETTASPSEPLDVTGTIATATEMSTT